MPDPTPRQESWLFAEHRDDDRSSHLHRQAIGWLGILLTPVLLVIGSGNSVACPEVGSTLPSVSAYFYTRGSPFFTGTLGALALFLLTYRGYDRTDQLLGGLAGAAGFLVALFPTSAPCDAMKVWWADGMEKVHYTSAATLFGCFTVLCAFRFTRGEGKPPPGSGKWWRNRIYAACGLVMIASLGLITWAGLTHKGWPIIWFECAALTAFGIAWIVKGRVDYTAGAVYRWFRGRPEGGAPPDPQLTDGA